MLAYLQTPLLAAFALLELCGCAPVPHHAWLPLSEWGHSEPSLSSWDYLGLGNSYPVQHRVDTPESWLPQPANPTIEIVRTYRKPAVDPAGWAQIPVIGGGRDSGRLWVALVPRGFEDFVLVRKPFVIVEETDGPSKGDRSGSKDLKDDESKDEKDKDDKKSDRAGETTKTTEPTSSTSTTVRSTSPSTTSTSPSTTSTSPSTTSTSTTPSTPPADDAENAASMERDSEPQATRNRPQK